LADLRDLPRPGDGNLRDNAWPQFIGDARVRVLGWPESVVEQFLFDHGTKNEFLSQYGHVDLETVTWDLRQLTAAEFLNLTVFEHFKDWLESSERDFQFRISQRPNDQRLTWERSQTWIVPPVLIDGSLLEPGQSRLHLVEGHTRVGILRGRLAAGVANPSQTHQADVGRLRLGCPRPIG
jgi:hypothetical protein